MHWGFSSKRLPCLYVYVGKWSGSSKKMGYSSLFSDKYLDCLHNDWVNTTNKHSVDSTNKKNRFHQQCSIALEITGTKSASIEYGWTEPCHVWWFTHLGLCQNLRYPETEVIKSRNALFWRRITQWNFTLIQWIFVKKISLWYKNWESQRMPGSRRKGSIFGPKKGSPKMDHHADHYSLLYPKYIPMTLG